MFDGTVRPITMDVAPYVRSIVAYDARLQKQRLKLSNLISEGGRGPKRMRTTRAAMSALEGGSRSATRKEKWFSADLNTALVLRTGGEGWSELVRAGERAKALVSGRALGEGGESEGGSGDGDSASDEGADELA